MRNAKSGWLVGWLMIWAAVAAPGRTVVPVHEIVKTRTGVEVYFFPTNKVPVFEIQLSFEDGAELDPPGRSGLTLFATGMPDHGVAGLDEDALSRRIDDLAAGIGVSADRSRTTVGAYGLNEHSAEIVELAFRHLETPTFPPAPFERMKANFLQHIRRIPESAASVATRAVNLLVFNTTPWFRPVEGFERELQRITRDDAREHYFRLTRRDRLRALVIGGGTLEKPRAVLENVVARIDRLGCAECGKPVPAMKAWSDPAFSLPAGKVVVIDRPGTSEAQVRIASLGPKQSVPEFYDLQVASTIFGGYFSSRLNTVIREELGLSYGIAGGYSFGPEIGLFSVATSTDALKVDELLLRLKALHRDFATGNVSKSELRQAKDYMTGSFPLALRNNYTVSRWFFESLQDGMDPEFLDRYVDRIRLVSREGIRRAVQKHFSTDRLITVVVGDAAVISKQLESAKIPFVKKQARDFL